MKKDYILEAKALIRMGISVIPVKIDGSKLPAIKWKDYQTRFMTDQEVEKYFKNCGGVIAITGKVSNLICIDFDLDKQSDTDDYWKSFMDEVPHQMKERMLINKTRSGGFHVWLRTDYQDKSRKITHRALTIPELTDRFHKIIESGANEKTASEMLLRKPVECVIETRSKGSYAVMYHPEYSRFYGKKIQRFTKDEVELLLNIGYSLDYNFKKPKPYTGDSSDYKVITKFNEDTTAEEMKDMVEKLGFFSLYDIDSNGNYRMSRVGSNSKFSAYIYADKAHMYVFGLNPISEDGEPNISPFDIYCMLNNLSKNEAIKKLKE